jgi:hypothetical protein
LRLHSVWKCDRFSPSCHCPMSILRMPVGTFTVKVILLISENLDKIIYLLSGFTWTMKISNAIWPRELYYGQMAQRKPKLAWFCCSEVQIAAAWALLFYFPRKLKSLNQDRWDCPVPRYFFQLLVNHSVILGELGPAHDRRGLYLAFEILSCFLQKLKGMLLGIQIKDLKIQHQNVWCSQDSLF